MVSATAVPSAHRVRSVDGLIAQLREAFNLDEGQAAKLSLVRRGAIYACVSLRADMIAGLPLCLYRVTGADAARSLPGRRVSVRDPRARLGMPRTVRGIRLADAGEVELVEDHPVLRRLARPNADWTGRALIRMTETGLGVVGQAHWRLHRAGSTPGAGAVEAISWVRDGRMTVVKPSTADEKARYRTVAGWTLDAALGMGGDRLAPEDVVWLRYPDPEDPDYGALAPAAVARLGAESYTAALRANRDIFRRGLRADAIVTPTEEFAGQFSSENVGELQEMIDRVLSGETNNHAVRALPYPMNIERLDVTPADAEFMALLEVCVEDVARAYRIPIEMVGGTRRTYQNNEVADIALWQRSLEPEAAWIAEELGYKLLPAFGLDPNAYFLAFDLSEVVALQDDDAARWAMEREQLERGVILANEWRIEHGREELPTAGASIEVGKVGAVLAGLQAMGSGLVAPASLEALIVEAIGLSPEAAKAIVGDGPPPELDVSDAADDTGEDVPRGSGGDGATPVEPLADPSRLAVAPLAVLRGGPAFDSADHRAAMARAEDAMRPHDRAIEREMRAIFEAQRTSVLDKLRDARVAGGAQMRLGIADLAPLFSRARWIRDSRIRMLPRLLDAARAGGRDVAKALDETPAANAAANAMRRQAQRFATLVTDTTWDRLRGSLAAGIEGGESIADLAKRVGAVFDRRSRSDAMMIARTESHAAYHRGGLETVKGFGGAFEKTWLSALDARVRDDHRAAHGQTVAMDDDFSVGGARGPMPGELGEADQDINCRCTATYSRAGRSAGHSMIASGEALGAATVPIGEVDR